MGILVKDIMEKNPVIMDSKRTIFELRETVILRQAECVLVTNLSKKIVGILTASHLATIADRDANEPVTSIMERKFKTIVENMQVKEAALILSSGELDALPVINSSGDLVGIVSYKDIVKDMVEEDRPEALLSPESAVIYLSMTKDPEQEEYWLQKVNSRGYKAAITQVGATAEKLPIKLREATIVAAIARSVIKEDTREKFAINLAVRDLYSQCATVNPGLGGGFKVAIVRGEGRIAIAAFGRCGHALSNGNEQIFMGSNII